MIRQRLIALLASGTVALSVLTACGGSTSTTSSSTGSQSAATAVVQEPTTSQDSTSQDSTSQPTSASELPLFPDAKPFDSSSPMAAAVDSMKQQMAQQQSNATVDIYELPSGVKFEQVKTFYNDELGKQGYSELKNQQQAQMPQGAGMAIWTNGSDEAVSLMVMDNPMGGAILIIGHGKGQ